MGVKSAEDYALVAQAVDSREGSALAWRRWRSCHQATPNNTQDKLKPNHTDALGFSVACSSVFR